MIVSEMHFNALRSLTQPCMTAYWLYHSTYDPGTSPGSANQCILGDVYLRSNLPRKVFRLDELTASSMDLQSKEQDQAHRHSRKCTDMSAFFTAKRLIKQSRIYRSPSGVLHSVCCSDSAVGEHSC